MSTSTTAKVTAIADGATAFCDTFGDDLAALEFGKWEDFSIPGTGATLADQRAARYDGYAEVVVAVRRLCLEQGVRLAIVPVPDGLRLIRLDKSRA